MVVAGDAYFSGDAANAHQLAPVAKRPRLALHKKKPAAAGRLASTMA